MKRILLLDDDAPFLETVARLFQTWSKGDLEIVCAAGPGPAILKLQKEVFDLVVLDVRMPVVDGIQFLQLLQRKLPDLQKVVLTGYPDDAARAACFQAGASFFLAKPCTGDEMESLYRTLHALVMIEPEEGFRGVLQRVGLPDVVQMECLAHKTSLLELRAGELTGQIFIEQGSVVHAEVGELQGPEAFYQLMSMRGGNFRFKTFRMPVRPTIQASLEGLLLEAARRQDERVAPPPIPAAERLLKHTVRMPSRKFTGRTSLLKPPAFPAATPQPEASTRPALPAEIVICDLAGEPGFTWQSPNADLRGVFLEFLRAKAEGLSCAIPGLGSLNRLEIHGVETRGVAVLEAGRSLYAGSGRGGLDVAALGDFLSRELDNFVSAQPGA